MLLKTSDPDYSNVERFSKDAGIKGVGTKILG